MLAFEVPQSVSGTEDINRFLTSVDRIEADTGLDFLSELPDDVEEKVEAETATAVW